MPLCHTERALASRAYLKTICLCVIPSERRGPHKNFVRGPHENLFRNGVSRSGVYASRAYLKTISPYVIPSEQSESSVSQSFVN